MLLFIMIRQQFQCVVLIFWNNWKDNWETTVISQQPAKAKKN